MNNKFISVEKNGYVYWICPQCTASHLYEELDVIDDDVYRCVLCGAESGLDAY